MRLLVGSQVSHDSGLTTRLAGGGQDGAGRDDGVRTGDLARSYAMGRAWKLAGLCEVSSRGSRPHFGLDRSPQQAESWQPQAIIVNEVSKESVSRK